MDRKEHKKTCKALEFKCKECTKKRHFTSMSKSKETPKSKRASSVRFPRSFRASIKAQNVDFNNLQTPTMKDVAFMPLGKAKPRKVTLQAYPDTGAEQSMVSQDLVKKMCLVVDENMSKT